MFDFFDQIIGFGESLFNFVVNMVQSLILALNAVAQAALMPLALVPILPAILGVSVTVVVALAVVKFVIGR